MGIQTTTLLVLAALSVASAFYQLVPPNKELVYDYKALVKAGTLYPEDYASEFYLYGKLYVTLQDHNVYMKFKDLSYKTYNGKVDHDHEAKFVPVEQYVEELTSVFGVTYNENGIAESLLVNKNEHPFAINIKKGVVSTFQMQYQKVMGIPKKHAFMAREPSIYGWDNTHYNVYSTKKDVVTVERYYEANSTRDWYYNMISNAEFSYQNCQDNYEQPMTQDSVKVYTLKKSGDQYVAEHITTNGGVYIHPFKAQSEAQHLYTNVTYELISMNPSTDKYMVENQMVEKVLKYKLYDLHMEVEGIPDIYQGRRNLDMKRLETDVNKMLEEIVEYMAEHHIHSKIPDVKKGQLMNRVQRPMSNMDYKTVEHLWTVLSQMPDNKGKLMLQMYEELLPVVATKATLKFIVHLIAHKKIKDSVSSSLLSEMPLNVKVPTIQLLQEMEEMLKFDSKIVSKDVQKDAILAFSTMVHKTNVYCSRYNIDFSMQAKKYVQKAVDAFAAAKTADEKMLYMSALHNMELKYAMPYLKAWISGEMKIDMFEEHFQLMAMWAIYPLIEHNQEDIYEVYWPIMTDPQEKTAHRILAFYLMMQSQPSLSRMINIYWFMVQEKNHEVYQFYYRYMYRLSQTNDVCLRKHQLYAQQVLKYVHPPNFYGMTGYYGWDYTDEDYGFGKGFYGLSIFEKNSVYLRWSGYANFFNVPFFPGSMLMKIHGLEGIENIGLNTMKGSTTLFSTEQFMKFLNNMDQKKNIHFEIVLFKENKIISSHFVEMKKDVSIFNFVNKWVDFVKKSHMVDISSRMYSKVFLPTDMGFVASMDWVNPDVLYTDLDIKKETIKDVTTYHVDVNVKHWSHSRYGLSFYNPVTDVWQGVNRYRSFDASFPLYFDVMYHMNPFTVKVTFKRHGDKQKDTFGYRNHVTTMTFVKDDLKHGILEKSIPSAKRFEVVTKGDQYRHDYPSIEEPVMLVGYDHIVTVYDSERLYTNKSLQDLPQFVFPFEEMFETGSLFAMLASKWDHMYLQPEPGTNGVLEMFVPSKTYPATSFDLTIRTNYEVTHEDFPLLPGVQAHLKFSFTSYKGTEQFKKWDVHSMYSVTPGHKVHNLKMQFHRILNTGPAFKFCIEGTKKYSNEFVTGYFSLAEKVGPVEDKCTEEDKIFDVTMKGVKSEEQLVKYPVYGECEEYVSSMNGFHHKLLPCYMAHDTFRNYTYDFHVGKNIKNEYKKFFIDAWDAFKGAFYMNYEFFDQHEDHVEQDHTIVHVTYPLYGKTFNTYVMTPNHAYHFEDLEDSTAQWAFFHPDTIHYTIMYKFMHGMGMTNYCSVYNDSIQFQYNAIDYNLPSEWTMIVGDKKSEPTYAVFVKELPETHHMALKLVHKTKTLMVEPTTQENHYDITLDGKKMTEDFFSGDWFFYQQQPHTNFMGIIEQYLGVHMFYDGTHVHIDVPKVDVPYYGQCYPDQH